MTSPSTTDHHTRARHGLPAAARAKPALALPELDLPAIAPHMFALMLRNVATDGYVFTAPGTGERSRPGCILAAPSSPGDTPGIDQDYVFNWVRDAAITAIEIAEARIPEGYAGDVQSLVDYVTFARLCAANARPTLGHACFTIGGEPRPWTEQNDGPALQTLALLRAHDGLDAATQSVAAELIATNLQYLLANYQSPTTNLWEEHEGQSFFARAVQLRCFREVAANTIGLPVPAGTTDAVAWLENALAGHWDGNRYVSMLPPPDAGYDPNIDIVCASIYGAIPVTDAKLLATAAQLRRQWSDPGSPALYPINTADAVRGIGPLLGRYPGDRYDGDVADPVIGGHPWALCTCNMAELQYTLANAIVRSDRLPFDELSRPFFALFGLSATSTPAEAAAALRSSADAMLRAVIFHSDGLELSEQFDGTTGYEKSVRNLTWSYAAFLSAVRAARPSPA